MKSDFDLWEHYKLNHLDDVLMSLNDNNFNDGYSALAVRDALKSCSTQKEVNALLKSALPTEQYQRINNRYRAYIFRRKNQTKTIAVRSDMHQRLAALKIEYGVDSFDEMFEILLEKVDGYDSLLNLYIYHLDNNN